MMVDLIKSLFIRFGVVGVSGSQWEYFSMSVQMSKKVDVSGSQWELVGAE